MGGVLPATRVLDWLLRLVSLGHGPAKVREHTEHARHWVDELVGQHLNQFIVLPHKGKQVVSGMARYAVFALPQLKIDD